MSVTPDELARALDVGCDFCGHRIGLEKYEPHTWHVWTFGLRCVDEYACNAREVANDDAEGRYDE